MECYFSFEVNAPDGLGSISSDLDRSELNLYIWKSGYNGKVILRSKPNGMIDLDMDSSDTDRMFGSGTIQASFEKAKSIIDRLSSIFTKHSLPHEIGVDSEAGEETYNVSNK